MNDVKRDDEEHAMDKVEIMIDGARKMIHRGRQTVLEIKLIGGIPSAYDLDELVDGRLIPLADEGSVTIKGGEQFFSHVKDSGSSH